jgi:hypothetical protein
MSVMATRSRSTWAALVKEPRAVGGLAPEETAFTTVERSLPMVAAAVDQALFWAQANRSS